MPKIIILTQTTLIKIHRTYKIVVRYPIWIADWRAH